MNYIWKYKKPGGFAPSGISNIGFVGPYNPNNTSGKTSFTVIVFQGSGGETRIDNNSNGDNILYDSGQ